MSRRLTLSPAGWLGLIVVALLIAANHAEHAWRPKPTAAPGPVVRAEDGPGGHTTIALREDPAGMALTFARLGTWDYQPGAAAPPEVARLDGQTVTITGFMYPLAAGERLTTFCLLRSTQTCCFGPRPQLTQYLLVETTQPVALERLAPITARGVFRLDPQPTQGYVYRLERATVSVTAPRGPDPDAWAASHGQTRWRWSLLDQAGLVAEPPVLPMDLTAVDGLPAVVDGFVHRQGPEGLLVAAQAPGPGPAPGLRQALTVHLAPGQEAPAKPSGAWEGVLRVTRDPQVWPDTGVVRLEDARPIPTVLAVEDDRWLVSPALEGLLLLAVLVFGLRRRAATALLLLGLLPGISQAEEVVLAEVGGQRITALDVQRGLPRDLFGALRQEARARRLDRLMSNAKAAAVYARLGPSPTTAEVDAAYRELLIKPLPASCGCHTATTIEEYLRLNALTVEDLREGLRLERAERKELDRSWQAAHPGSDTTWLATEAPRLRAEFIRFWQIPFYAGYQEVVTDDPLASGCGKRAVEAHAKLMAGADFRAVAQEAGCFNAPEQPAGDAGIVGRADPITTGAATGNPPPIPAESLSPPRRTNYGFVILRWRELEDAEVVDRLRTKADWNRRRELVRLIHEVPVHLTAAGKAILPLPATSNAP